MGAKLDILNKKFNKLTAIKFTKNSKNHNSIWLFKCDCGKEKEIEAYRVKNNTIKSCGCYHVICTGNRFRKHGYTNTRIYNIWQAMKSRCYNTKNKRYKDYGGRGIKVCKEWKNSFEKFYNWSINNNYQINLTIDRKNNNQGYSPKNCKWSTYKEQCNNKRNNNLITFNGQTKTITEWAALLNIDRRKLNFHINKGYSPEEALSIMKYNGFDGREHSVSLSEKKKNNISALHKRARDLLKRLYPFDKIFEEVALPGSNTNKNKQLFADFFIPSKDLIVEIHGEQHYQHISFFHKTKSEFLKSKNRDSVKRDWCQLNSITLIELPFNENDEQWKERIENRNG